MLYFPAYFSSDEGRRYEGFPTMLKVYAAQQTDIDNFEHAAAFYGTPQNKDQHYMFVQMLSMAFKGVRGVYADQSYVSSHMIPSSSFKATCNGRERS